ncbi:nitroreductase [Thermotomaculum hydrothermale]|uniref:Nitroreductase n=1 Tax=Thermotomaculum hydrothermale TaxID=981385 RepID=A0A7R6SXZ3_9BACT|nr:nitroreductase family protein [Thermotomaculum hydrothermale]BBB32026.1 nitroreductase [Thermotomaculum hydrothermale]
MDLIKAIFQRRSIRKYRNKPVEKHILMQLVKYGMYAPTARNTRSWHFYIVSDREKLDEVAKKHPYAGMLKTAGGAILVCGDKSIEPMEGYLSLNCANACENIMLGALEHGLGTCWIAVYPREERIKLVSEIFNLPENHLPIALISVGYPDEEKQILDRFEKEKITFI